MAEGFYLCIDLKSFFASVEAVDRGLDPFTTNLVVADPSRKLGLVKKGMMITVRFYRTDAYDTITGLVTRIDPEYRYITIVKTKIPFDDITEVSSPEIPDGE